MATDRRTTPAPPQGTASRRSGRTRRALAAVGLTATLVTTAVATTPVTSAAAPTPPGPVAEWGTAAGTDGRVYITDTNGRALQFHGFNHKTDDPATLTDDLLDEAVERGMDHVRLAIYWDQFEPVKDVWDEAYFARLRAALDRAEDHGLLVILDMHQDVFSQRFSGAGIPDWATRDEGLPFDLQETWFLNYLQPGVQAAWEHLYEDADLRQEQIQAWTHVVEQFKDHPAVLGYDLLNEPFGKIRPGEDLLSAAERVERVQLTAMYQRLTDAITAIDADHWIFIEPPNLASLGIPTSLGKVDGPKVVLYPHMYDADIETATYTPGGQVQINREFFTKWADAISTYTARNPIPMLVGEWGLASPEKPGMDEFVALSLQTLDRTTSGWSVFNWCKGSGYCPIDASGNDRPGIGQIFQPFAKAIAGTPTSTSWDRNTRTLTLRFTDGAATGTTDIYLNPSRSYPEGWTVATSEPDGSWSQSFDAATGVLSVTIEGDAGAAHAICVQPEGAPAGCAATVEEPPTTPTTPPSPTPAVDPATGAQPVSGQPSYTG